LDVHDLVLLLLLSSRRIGCWGTVAAELGKAEEAMPAPKWHLRAVLYLYSSEHRPDNAVHATKPTASPREPALAALGADGRQGSVRLLTLATSGRPPVCPPAWICGSVFHTTSLDFKGCALLDVQRKVHVSLELDLFKRELHTGSPST